MSAYVDIGEGRVNCPVFRVTSGRVLPDRGGVVSRLQEITPGDVASVYVGRKNKCCCGCSGEYYENPAPGGIVPHAPTLGEEAQAAVRNKMIIRVLRTVQAYEGELLDDGPDNFSVNVGSKVYIVHLSKEPAQQSKVNEVAS